MFDTFFKIKDAKVVGVEIDNGRAVLNVDVVIDYAPRVEFIEFTVNLSDEGVTFETE